MKAVYKLRFLILQHDCLMSVILEVSIPAEDFVLGEALKADADITVRLERVVPLEEGNVPYFRVQNHDLDSIEAALRESTDLNAFEVIDNVGDEALIRVEWTHDTDGFIEALTLANGSLLEAIGSGDSWEIQIRFDDHDNLTRFYRHCVDCDISMTLRRMHNPGIPDHRGLDFSLTETQRETLLRAFEAGYFDIPRRTTLVELAEELGVSDTATSQRLRRGITTLLLSTLAEVGTDEDHERTDGP
jgi:predicted DNA binding protein